MPTLPCRRSALLLLLALATAGSVAADPNDTLGARYDLIRETCTITGNEFTHDVHVRLTVLNRRGDDYAHIAVAESKYLQIDDVRIEVTDAGGQPIASYKKKDMQWLEGFSDGTFANDIKHYYLTLNPPEYPFTIEYTYRSRGKSLMFLPVFLAQRAIPVTAAEFEISTPSEAMLHFRSYPKTIPPDITEESGRRRYQWQFNIVAPLPDIDYVPPGCNEPIYIAFAAEQFELEGVPLESCTWNDIGRWHSRLSRDRYLPRPAEGITPPTDPYAVVREEYDRIISETRYVAIEIGLGGWQPRPASLTAQRGFGDCKDLSTLLASRLINAGIEAHTTRLLTRDLGLTDTTFPAVRFNHVITVACVDADTIWMDPTCSSCPLGDLPVGDEATATLVSTDDGGLLRRTPPSTSADNTSIRTVSLHLQPDYTLTFAAVLEITGNYAHSLRNALDGVSDEEQRALLSVSFPGTDKTLTIDSFSVANLHALYDPLLIRVCGHSLRPERVFRSTLYHSPYLMNSITGLLEVNLTSRSIPLDIGYPHTTKDIITVSWAPELVVDSLTPPVDTASAFSFGALELRCHPATDSVTIELTRRFDSYQIGIDQFAEFEQYRQLLREIYKGYLKLRLRG